MADFGVGEAIALAGLATAATSATYSGIEQHKADKLQQRALADAERKQAEADRKAETERLQALAKEQEDRGFDFGVDSVLARSYADAAQKWEAGTGSMDTDEDNPFYTKGLF